MAERQLVTPSRVVSDFADHYDDHMKRQVTATEAKAKLLALLDDVEKGEEIEITRHGITIARLSPARGPHALKDRFKDVVTFVGKDEDLFSTGLEWNLDNYPP